MHEEIWHRLSAASPLLGSELQWWAPRPATVWSQLTLFCVLFTPEKRGSVLCILYSLFLDPTISNEVSWKGLCNLVLIIVKTQRRCMQQVPTHLWVFKIEPGNHVVVTLMCRVCHLFDENLNCKLPCDLRSKSSRRRSRNQQMFCILVWKMTQAINWLSKPLPPKL